MKWRVYVCFWSLLIVSSSLTFASDKAIKSGASPSVAEVDLHELITQYRPQVAGSVDIVLFRKLSFSGDVIAMPERRKSAYVNRLVNNFSKGEALAPLAHGIELLSSEGGRINVYVTEELVPMIQQDLMVGDQISVSAYHAYTSDYGPGLIVYAYERHSPPAWKARFMRWIDKFMNATDNVEAPTLISAGGT